MPNYVLLVILLLLGKSALAYDVECTKGWAEINDRYPELVCLGDRLMLEGKYSAALHSYSDAAQLEFFESPNFLIYVRIARAECAIGERTRCQHTLKDFELMLDVYVGKTACPRSDAKNGDVFLSTTVIRVMCDEVLIDSYRDRSETAKKQAALMEESYRRQLKVIRSQYSLNATQKSNSLNLQGRGEQKLPNSER